MNTFTKSVLIAVLTLLMIGILWGCYKIFILGNYLENASFITSALVIIGSLVALYLTAIAIRSLIKNNNTI